MPLLHFAPEKPACLIGIERPRRSRLVADGGRTSVRRNVRRFAAHSVISLLGIAFSKGSIEPSFEGLREVASMVNGDAVA